MNKRGQATFVLTTIIVVILAGFLLAVFQPTIEDVRINTLEDTSEDDTLLRLVLFSLNPIIWVGYVFFSVIAIAVSVQMSNGVL